MRPLPLSSAVLVAAFLASLSAASSQLLKRRFKRQAGIPVIQSGYEAFKDDFIFGKRRDSPIVDSTEIRTTRRTTSATVPTTLRPTTTTTLRTTRKPIVTRASTRKTVPRPTQPKKPRPNCSDIRADCPTWAANGECEKNPFWMKPNCQKSCNSCGMDIGEVNKTEKNDNDCKDQHPLCGFWSSIGECSQNSDWMDENCRLSCTDC